MAAWQVFTEGKDELTESEARDLEDFIARWEKLNWLVENNLISSDVSLSCRVKEFQGDQGKTRLVVHAIDKLSSISRGKDRLFLIVRDSTGKDISLTLAPEIEGFKQRIDPDGEKVEYTNQNGEVMLIADAMRLQSGVKENKALKDKQIGAYHVSRWVLYSLSIKDLEMVQWIIQNGRANQQMILVDCP